MNIRVQDLCQRLAMIKMYREKGYPGMGMCRGGGGGQTIIRVRDKKSTSLEQRTRLKQEFYLFPLAINNVCLEVCRSHVIIVSSMVDREYMTRLTNRLQQLPSIRQHLRSCSSQFAQERPPRCCSSP